MSAQKVKKSEFAGVGSLVQLLGLVLLFVFPIGTVAGIILIIMGSRMSFKYRCGAYGNTVEKESKLCPTCKEVLAD